MSNRAIFNDDVIGDFERYAARASAALTDTEIDDLVRSITSHPLNAETLRRLKNDDPSLTRLQICFQWVATNLQFNEGGYVPEACSIGWLGHFVGESTNLKVLHLSYLDVNPEWCASFFNGMNRNRSVRHLSISSVNAGFQELTRFFAENKNLVEVVVEPAWELNGGIAHRLSQAMRSCTLLKSFTFSSNSRYDEEVEEIINSLSEKSNLEEVELVGCLGRRGYRALAGLLAWEGSQLQSLRVSCNRMDVQDFECLLNAVASNGKLQKLDMAEFDGRDNIIHVDEDEDEDDEDLAIHTLIRAWGLIDSQLLKAFTSNLVELDITRGDNLGSISDEGAVAFSHALAGNRNLKVLKAGWCRLTSRGWDAVSKLLCNTSSPGTTHASNHTLQELGLHRDINYAIAVNVMFQNQIGPLLALNRNDDKSYVASAKILKTHNDFDMQVFFEWEFKMLPITVQWLERAAISVLMNLPADPNIQRRKLSVIYQFVRSAPKLFVECRLRGELEEIRVRKEKIRGELEWLEERRRVIMNKLRGD